MPQYRHSKHARRFLADFEKERRKTVSFALLTFIVLMVATIACTLAVSSFNSLTGIRSHYDYSRQAYLIPKDLAQANACSTYISSPMFLLMMRYPRLRPVLTRSTKT